MGGRSLPGCLACVGCCCSDHAIGEVHVETVAAGELRAGQSIAAGGHLEWVLSLPVSRGAREGRRGAW